jgi:hypothetical protein
MAAARKSAVSATGTWLRRDSTPSSGKRRFRRREPAGQSATTPAAEPAMIPSQRQRRDSKNVSVSGKNELKDLDKQKIPKRQGQSNTTQKNPRSGFLHLPVMPTSGAAPSWLLRFYTWHRYSSVVAFLLVASTLIVYGWTVYSQEVWSQGYRRLQNLQRRERQLTTTNATLKYKMAEEAEQPTTGLVSPTPARTIFLSPTDNPNSTTPITKPNSEAQQQAGSPLGY